MQNDKLIIVNFSVNSITKNVDVHCYLPSTHILGNFLTTKTISFLESELLPSDNWSNTDLKNALSIVTNISIDQIVYFDELSEVEQLQIQNTSGFNQYMVKTFI